MSIKRIQKTALRIIYQENYQSYSAACEMASISTLEERRIKLCSKFALRALKNEKFSYWFKRNETSSRTRLKKPMFQPVLSRTSRYDNKLGWASVKLLVWLEFLKFLRPLPGGHRA